MYIYIHTYIYVYSCLKILSEIVTLINYTIINDNQKHWLCVFNHRKK